MLKSQHFETYIRMAHMGLRLSTLLVIPLFISSCDYFSSPLLKACEEALKQRLASPSGYKRISYTESQKNISYDEYETIAKRQNPTQSAANIRNARIVMERVGKVPVQYYVGIEYDAPNGYGTPIRGGAACDYYTDYGDTRLASYMDVFVNGQNWSEWLAATVKR